MFSKYVKISGKDVQRMAKRGVTEKDLLKFGTEKYNPKAAVKDAIEHLYFEDLEKKELKDYLKDISKKKTGPDVSGGKVPLTQRLPAERRRRAEID